MRRRSTRPTSHGRRRRARGQAADGENPPANVAGYDILAELGRGGMGVVYKAYHRQLDRVVALKMVLAGPHAGKNELTRFQQEARAIAQLQHPNIIQIHEIGSHDGFGVKVWSTRDGKLLFDLIKKISLTRPTFSPDGRWLYNHDGRRWRVGEWSEDGRQVGALASLALAPDRRLLAHGTDKGFIRLLDPESGKELARLEDPNQDGLLNMIFSGDGGLLLGVTNDSFSVHIWDLRKIRAGLKELGLDWDAPPYPEAEPRRTDSPGVEPLQITLLVNR